MENEKFIKITIKDNEDKTIDTSILMEGMPQIEALGWLRYFEKTLYVSIYRSTKDPLDM